MIHATTTRSSRIQKGPSTRTRGSPHVWYLVLHCDADGRGKTAQLTQGTMNVADQGKVVAVTTPRQTVEQQTMKELLPCVRQCRRTKSSGRTSVASSFPVGRADRIQVEKSPTRRAICASSTWRQQRRTRRTGAECTDRSQSGMSSSFARSTAPQGRALGPHGKTIAWMRCRNRKRRRKKMWRS